MINSTGLPRRIDHLGRIVVPVELRRLLGINPGDELEISAQGDSITLTRMRKACVFCATEENLRSYRDKMFCQRCAAEASAEGNGSHREGSH